MLTSKNSLQISLHLQPCLEASYMFFDSHSSYGYDLSQENEYLSHNTAFRIQKGYS